MYVIVCTCKRTCKVIIYACVAWDLLACGNQLADGAAGTCGRLMSVVTRGCW